MDYTDYFKKKGHMLSIVLLIVGGLNYGATGIFKVNLIERLLGKNTLSARALYLIYGLAAVSVMFNRDTYLPFLGEAVMPCSLLQNRAPPGATYDITVNVGAHAKVLYWAAEPDTDGLKKIGDWRQAYLKFMNAGVVKADGNGVAVLLVRSPQPYTVPWKGRIEPHIHFRVCGGNGMLDRIKTVFVSDGRVEGFTG